MNKSTHNPTVSHHDLTMYCIVLYCPCTDEEHLAACLHPPGGANTSTDAAAAPNTALGRALQHCATGTRMHGLQQQQMHPQSPLLQLQGGSSSNDSPDWQRRVTVGAVAGEGGGGVRYGGGLVLRPGPGALPHSMSERPSSRDGRAAQGELRWTQKQSLQATPAGRIQMPDGLIRTVGCVACISPPVHISHISPHELSVQHRHD